MIQAVSSLMIYRACHVTKGVDILGGGCAFVCACTFFSAVIAPCTSVTVDYDMHFKQSELQPRFCFLAGGGGGVFLFFCLCFFIVRFLLIMLCFLKKVNYSLFFFFWAGGGGSFSDTAYWYYRLYYF